MSKEYKGKKIVIYPSYIDKRLTRRLGRRVPTEFSIVNPRIEEIYEAAMELGLEPIIEEDVSYPRVWYYQKGRIIVKKEKSKQELLKEIAKYIINKRKKSKKL